jgi:hypothetical protein
MYKQVFVFGTPEGGASDIKFFFQEAGFTCSGSTEVKNLYFEEAFFEIVNGGHPLMRLAELNIFGCQRADDEVVVYFDVFETAKLGTAEHFMPTLATEFPDAKFVFAHMEDTSNLARILATNRKWVPDYGTCISKCEFRMKMQINEFHEFASKNPERSLVFNAKHGDWNKLLEFVTK